MRAEFAHFERRFIGHAGGRPAITRRLRALAATQYTKFLTFH